MQAKTDSIYYLSYYDTIFLTIDYTGEKLIEHRIDYGQTLYSLARFYGLSVEELYFYNPGLNENGISVDDLIRIPIPNRAIIRYKHPNFLDDWHVPIYYVVKKGDTLFRIAKVYFQMPVEDVMYRNGLINTNLSTGQLLHLGWMSIEGIPDSLRSSKVGINGERNNSLRKVFRRDSKNLKSDSGVAFWQKESKKSSGLYVLHRSAKLNSIIEVENPMNRRTVYAKVVGRIPPTIYDDDVRIVLSPYAAKLLRARDPRFFVKIRYRK